MKTFRYLVLCLVLWSVQPSFSQYHYSYFGTNKVNYTSFKWSVLATEHFDIYYYAEMRELAERAAGMAEEQYLELQTRFNHSLQVRVPMIVFSSHLHFQQTNVTPFEIPEGIGGFFEFFKGRVVLPSDGSTYHFRRVLRHELVHVFMTSKINRILNDHRKLNHPGAPLWFTEGLAEYWSGDPDFQAEMVMRDATINNTIVPVQNFYTVEGTYYMYKLGENLLHFIGQRYGPEKILLLMENIWKSDSFEKVMLLTVGKNYEDLSSEWTYWLRKKYYPSLENRDPPSAVSTVITRSGFNSKPVYFRNGDADEVYFVANHDGFTNIYRQDLTKDKAEVVVKGERTHEFETFHFFKSKIDIHAGGQLAFVAKSGETDVLYVYDVHRRRITHRYRFDHLVGLASPSWSPDGKALVISGLASNGNSDLYRVRVTDGPDDGELDKLTNDFYDDKEPAWSPNGQAIAFSSDRTVDGWQGHYNIFLLELSTGRIEYLTKGACHDAGPAWSADGTRIVFSSNQSGSTTDVWTLPIARDDQSRLGEAHPTSSANEGIAWPEPRRITRFTTAAFDPVVTPRGDLIFTAFEEFSFKIRHLKQAADTSSASPWPPRPPLAGARKPWTTPRVAITESNSRPYSKKYGLDFVQGALQADPVFGSGGGAQMAVTDMLGNDQYYFVIYNTARSTSSLLTDWNFVATKVNLNQRANFAYGLFRFKGDFLEIGDQGGIEIVDEHRYGGFFAVTYPLSKFQRLETSVSASRFKREESFQILPVDGILVSNFMGYTFDNSWWGPSGPLDGSRWGVKVGYTSDVRNSQQNYYTAIVDFRQYMRLTLRSAFAVRAMVQWNDGKNPQNFLLGGSWDMRGYPRWNLPGTRFFVINNELRFPFVDAVNLRLPFGGFGLRSIRGAVFLDLGNAWGSQVSSRNVVLRNEKFDGVLGSVGTGFRINLWNVIVLRFDFGKMFDLRGYAFGGVKLPGSQDRFVATKLSGKGNQGFGGTDLNGDPRRSRWSPGIFFQFWFGVDY